MNIDTVVYDWECGSYSGYGIAGLNLSLFWPGRALAALAGSPALLPAGDPRKSLLEQRLAQSRSLRRELAGDPHARLSVPLFVGLGNNFRRGNLPNGATLGGTPEIAFPVIEEVAEIAAHAERLRPYATVIAMSRWNAELLRSLGVPAVLWHQGYDPMLFNPGVRRRPRADGRFRVFSGGKAEFRKGQDLVLQAFVAFAATHPDAMLMTTWYSAWPGLAREVQARAIIGAPPLRPDGYPDCAGWAQRCGIAPRQFEPLPPRPNCLMPELLAEVDVAVFPNRLEGGTNLVAMECLACGVPTILARGHGHDDLIADGYGIAYQPAAPNPFWRGAEVEPIVDALTAVYDGRAATGPPLGPEWAWPSRITELAGILRAL